MGEVNVLQVEELIRNYEKQTPSGVKDEIKVLKGLNFNVEEGEFVGIMGKSGCGKTTLLKVLGLIDKQTGGILKFMGKDTNGLHPDELADIRRTQIGFIFQDFYLMDSLSVEENIMLPMILNKEKSEVMSEKAKQLAKQFQIDHLLGKDPYLSPPIILSLTMQEAELLNEHMDRFERIGFEIEPFGGDEYAVRAVPDNLFSIAKKELLMEMLS